VLVEEAATNNQMELQAAILALREAKDRGLAGIIRRMFPNAHVQELGVTRSEQRQPGDTVPGRTP
jgi:hypothetical protein